MTRAKPRYIAKPFKIGRFQYYGVFDQLRSCWPVVTEALGEVKQDMRDEDEATAEAARCEKEAHR